MKLGIRYEFKEVVDNHFATLGKYCNWYSFSYQSDGPHYRLVFECPLEQKWTSFIAAYVRSIIESIGTTHIENESVNDNMIVFEVRNFDAK